jgi:DMSO/TMAO reductase YedYZ molybdopterin-dependent catalytic subunit
VLLNGFGGIERKGMKKTAIFFVSVALLSTALSSCGRAEADTATELESVEVREYKGENLSSIAEFRENSIKGPQYIDIEDYQLEVTGLVDAPTSYTYDLVLETNEHYEKVVTLNCVEGWSVNILWEGVLVKDLIAESDPAPEANTVIFHAYDGYITTLSLDYITGNDILMAYKMNDVVIPPERGFPFHLVAESKWGYKWVKWITKIELSDDPGYGGFWESRGYSNIGDLDKDFFDDDFSGR